MMPTDGAPTGRGRQGAEVSWAHTALRDSLAGLSVALVLIPQSLAYAELAGMPAHTGLYAAALPALAAAPFASSPYLQTGPTAMMSLLTLGALSASSAAGEPRYAALGALLALVVGAARVLVGLLRWGQATYLLSQTVLTGFTSAAALLIIASQLPTALGTRTPDAGVLPDLLWTVGRPGEWEWEAALLSAVTLLLVAGGRRIHNFFPGVLAAVAVGVAYSLLANYGGSRIGEIPAHLPAPSLALPWPELPGLLLPGLVIALVGFAEPAAIARTYAALDRKPWNPNREWVSQGVANLAAGVSGGFPVGGSFSRSALDRDAGARTRWSGAATGLAVFLFLPFAGMLSPLPRAVLGSIVIASVIGLVRPRAVLRLWRLSKPQFWLAASSFALTLALAPHVERAILAGLLLAVLIHLWRELRIEVEEWVEDRTLHLRPQGVLWFGSANTLEERFPGALSRHPEARRVVIHLDGLGRMDLTGALAIARFFGDVRAAGLEAEVTDVAPQSERLVDAVPGLRG